MKNSLEITYLKISSLKPFGQNPRAHSKRQIAQLASSIKTFGFNCPILVDRDLNLIAGEARAAAARECGFDCVPAIVLPDMSDARKRAFRLAHNKLALNASWDPEVLKIELEYLLDAETEFGFEIEAIGFESGEIDLAIEKHSDSDEIDDTVELASAGPPVSTSGDLWRLGRHSLLCGNALLEESYERLFDSERAAMVVTDPPYNVRIDGHARGRGKIRHREFAMASGEMLDAQYTHFLNRAMRRAVEFSRDGAIHYWFADWRHLPSVVQAGETLYSEWKNLLVWNKTNAGLGSMYRSKHELIAVFKYGRAAHVNNIALGATGRYRTNILDYPGFSALGGVQREDRDLHPTVKPTALIADLILDCSRPRDIVLDPFGGSGTALLAAERTRRTARLIEIDPLYVDVAVRRWQRMTGENAVHAHTGKAFGYPVAEPSVDAATSPAAPKSARRKAR